MTAARSDAASLRAGRVGTTFRDDGSFFRADWETRAESSRRTVAELNVPLSRVDAASVNPLDRRVGWDLVWLFEGPLVVDYRFWENTVSAATTIGEHPVFKALPAEYHQGVTAVIIDDPDVPGRADRANSLYVFLSSKWCRLDLAPDGDALRATLAVQGTLADWGVPPEAAGQGANDPLWTVCNGMGSAAGAVYFYFMRGGQRRVHVLPHLVTENGSTREQTPAPPAGAARTWSPPYPKAFLPQLLEPAVLGCATIPNGRTIFNIVRAGAPPSSLRVVSTPRPAGAPGALALCASLPTCTPTDWAGSPRADNWRGKSFQDQMLLQRGEVRRRDQAIVEQFKAGNVPDFMRDFVRATAVIARVAPSGRSLPAALAYYVSPQCVAVGSDDDFVRVALTEEASQRIADATGCILPTGKIVHDLWHDESPQRIPYLYVGDRPRVEPELAAGRRETVDGWAEQFVDSFNIKGVPLDVKVQSQLEQRSTTTAYWYDRLTEAYRRKSGQLLKRLTCGYKKEVVIGNDVHNPALNAGPPEPGPASRLGFYGGWMSRRYQRHEGPKQANGLAPAYPHIRPYSDYAQGTRLVYRRAWLRLERLAWREVEITDILSDPELHSLINGEKNRINKPWYPLPEHGPAGPPKLTR